MKVPIWSYHLIDVENQEILKISHVCTGIILSDLSKAPLSRVPFCYHAAFTNGRESFFWLVRFHFLESISELRRKKLRKGESHVVMHTGFLRVLLEKKKKKKTCPPICPFLQKLQWKLPWIKFLSWLISVFFPENVEQMNTVKENGIFEILLKVRHCFFLFQNAISTPTTSPLPMLFRIAFFKQHSNLLT